MKQKSLGAASLASANLGRAPVACLLILCASAVHCPPGLAQEPTRIVVEGQKVALDLPAWKELERREGGDDQLLAWWTGLVGRSEVTIEFRVFPRDDFGLDEPADITAFRLDSFRESERGGHPDFAYRQQDVFRGDFGRAPFAHVCAGFLPGRTGPEGEIICLGALLPDHGYSVTLQASPPLSKPARKDFMKFLREGVETDVTPRDHKWTEDEVKARWDRDIPTQEIRQKMRDVVRTEHYIIFTNASAGRLFAKKMEAFYDEVCSVFPFEEMKGERLMPVFVFRNREEYLAFCNHVVPGRGLRGTKGHAWKDYYATWYESPNDPVHIHEATHQIFMNRLRLPGGGAWFHEGVAEYMSTRPGERKAWARAAAKREEYVPFTRFIPHMAGDAHSAYAQAASIIEFLRDGRWQQDKFQTYVHRMGMTAPTLEAATAVLKEVYGVDVPGFEEQWREYWAK